MPARKITKKRPFTGVLPGVVQPGDILFFFNPHALSNKDQYDHVAICTGLKQRGKKVVPQITHATFNKTKTVQRVCETDLRPYASYLVFRFGNEKIAKKAAEVARYWNSFGVRYDFQRLKLMERFLASSDSLDHALKRNLGRYNKVGFLQSWKFASRYEQPFHQGSQHGFRCDQFVILCFQVAERLLSHQLLFKSQKAMQNCRVSLKYNNMRLTKLYRKKHPKQLSLLDKPLMKYLKKSGFVKDSNQPVLPISTIFTPMVYSKEQLVDGCLPLNPKRSSPSVFLHFLSQAMYGGGGDLMTPQSGFVFKGVILGQDQNKDQFPGFDIIQSDVLWIKSNKRQGVILREGYDLISGRDRFMHDAILRLHRLCLAYKLLSGRLVRAPFPPSRPAKKRRCCR